MVLFKAGFAMEDNQSAIAYLRLCAIAELFSRNAT
jgi:hypothetical protein